MRCRPKFLRLASRRTQHPILEANRGWHRYFGPKCSVCAASFGCINYDVVAKLGQSSIQSSVLAGGFRYIPAMDDHVRDRHHYELTDWHRTKGSLNDRCKIDLFHGNEHLIHNRNKRRFRPFRRE